MFKLLLSSICIVFLLLCNNIEAISQNLVPNHSFEIQDSCPTPGDIIFAQPWDSPSLDEADLFDTDCSAQNTSARTGTGSSGLFFYTPFPNLREYIQAPLIETLVAGQNYCVSFYVRRNTFRFAVNRIGAYFSDVAIFQNNNNFINVTPQVENDPENIILPDDIWTEISGSFVASGGETHIIIGNFYDDLNTDIDMATSNSSTEFSYYKIDDVSVTTCQPTSTIDMEHAEKSVSIYPVPAKEVVSIKIVENLTVLNSTIIDLHGRKIMDIPFDMTNAGAYSINISNLTTGVYFISLQTPHGIINKKVIKR